MRLDLTTVRVRPSGAGGIAARSAAGFIVLCGPDDSHLVGFVGEHQHDPSMIESLAGELETARPDAFAMLFTSGGLPHLIAWGSVAAQVVSDTARFSIEPIPEETLIHPIELSGGSTLVLRLADTLHTSGAISLDEGSVEASSVTVEVVIAQIDGEAGRTGGGASHPAASSDPTSDQPSGDASSDPAGNQPSCGSEPIDDSERDVLATAEPEGDDALGCWARPAEGSGVGPAPTGPNDRATGPPAAAEIVFADDHPAFDAPTRPVLTPGTTSRTVPDGDGERVAAARLGAQPNQALPGTVMVLGVSCPNHHHNHTNATYCTQCGARIAGGQTVVLINGPRPSLGVLVADDGATWPIDHDLILGRDPATHGAVRSGVALGVPITDETLAMSRHHAAVLLDEWKVNVTDLGSSNGTWLSHDPGSDDWIAVDAGTLVEAESGDRLRVGDRIVHIELHPH